SALMATEQLFSLGTSRQSMNLRPIMTSRHSQREQPPAAAQRDYACEGGAAIGTGACGGAATGLPTNKKGGREMAAALWFAEHRVGYRPAMMLTMRPVAAETSR